MKQLIKLLLIIYSINSYGQEVLLPRSTVEACLECMDILKQKNKIISYQDSINKTNNLKLDGYKIIIESYEMDSLSYSLKEDSYQQIIKDKNEEIRLKDKQIVSIKRERWGERILSIAIIIIIIIIAI